MCHYRIIFLVALSFVPSSLAAQGFDCSKAQTSVERLICATPEIATLDKKLNDAVKAHLAASPQQRNEFLAESRSWLSIRDKTCPVASAKMSSQELSHTIACLSKAYQDRLDAIASLPAQQISINDSANKVCNRLVDAYRTTISTRSNDPKDDNAPLNQRPFNLLAQTPNSGITRAEAGQQLSDINETKLNRWAQRQKPPLHFSPQVKKDILNLGSQITTIDHAPGTNFFVASQVAGSAACITSVSFLSKGGVAEPVGDLLWPQENMDGCGVDQFFGAIDGQPVAVKDNTGFFFPDLSRYLAIKAWDGAVFRPACTISFEYDPVLIDGTSFSLQDDDEKCISPECIALKPTAIELVKVVLHRPLDARKEAIARLSATQRLTYNNMEKLALDNSSGDISTPEKPADPYSYTDQNPLRLPVVYQGEIYLASVGQYTIGWRTFPDWTVKLEKLKNDALQISGIPYVAMRRGALRAATVR